MTAINRTNAQTVLHDGVALADALAKRDILAMRRTMIQEVINAAAVKQDRYSRSEVKFIPTVHIAELQTQVDQHSKAYRELDTGIQEMNWKTELL
ncbi:hypothetical protein SAMN04487970_103229 [Paenibacillus tianmuensis]|uniref:Uncharacterized protein n=1 Tax=Paenibacillus tianmuensis TaxID=624147 RepID=A0A1G4SNX4_9BACL|nr:DIP1984 family protein [Paenibacillus tianmuensis]SCW70944.1 hypothetical protein SAMN04487970_103229 [Paenibacillus tianmuensis]